MRATNWENGGLRRLQRNMSHSIMRTCASCGAKNRVPAEHLADTGRCGSCKAALPPLGEPIEVDPVAFDGVVWDSRVPVLVDFWAPWCAPCRMAALEVEALAHDIAGRAVVLKVDTEQHPGLAARFRIQGIPHFVIFRNGRVVFQRAGFAPRSEMRCWIEQTT